ncbi:hypothetical protein P154DRAFT_582354 [Amniculicola lignicola CBS 123094]|uniref:Peptidase C1A papain C-terminal domain-containing protein n=1 Tax=Amniculicola lignicola CBS 123094 TaxID=1392246 RepID=A0A6A5VVS3_9PLEO|nr:hypothetical protein P154DRAFT_582354 [Amniculicola lignicola CBS 123094]
MPFNRKATGRVRFTPDSRDRYVDMTTMGICACNAAASSYWYELKRLAIDLDSDGKPTFWPSRLFLYYTARFLDARNINNDLQKMVSATLYSGLAGNNPQEITIKDYGSEIREPCKILSALEVPSEGEYQTPLHDEVAPLHTSTTRFTPRVYGRTMMRIPPMILIATMAISIPKADGTGYPVIFSYTAYPKFQQETQKKDNGYVAPMPLASEVDAENKTSGHTVLAVGWDDDNGRTDGDGNAAKGCFKVKNSWSATWADEGCFWMPYEWIGMENPYDPENLGELVGDPWTLLGTTAAKL